jgi:hypothetical protein
MSYASYESYCKFIIYDTALRGLAKFVSLCNLRIMGENNMKYMKERPCGGIGRRLRLRTEGPIRA